MGFESLASVPRPMGSEGPKIEVSGSILPKYGTPESFSYLKLQSILDLGRRAKSGRVLNLNTPMIRDGVP